MVDLLGRALKLTKFHARELRGPRVEFVFSYAEEEKRLAREEAKLLEELLT